MVGCVGRRRKNRAVALVFAIAVPAIALAPLVAWGEPPKKPAPKVADRAEEKPDNHDPDNITAISQYMETVAKGIERYAAKDYTAAIDTFKKAVQLGPKQALAHYLLAETYLQSNNFGEAEAAIAQALDAQDTAKNPALRSRVLFVAADLQERQKHWEKAKVAWQAYAEHAAKLADAGHPQTSAERLKAIQKVLEMEKAYVAVRERIAAEKDARGKSAPPKKP
jgi:tetratricopeptide (TPR) repeat protein